jgi:lysophospholipase L1-like esterase
MTSCHIPHALEHIRAASYCNVAFIGGSLTTAAGAGDTTTTSWRRLFMRHLYERGHAVYHCQLSEIMGGLGAMESYGAVFTLQRNVIPFAPSLVFVEFAVNDRVAPTPDLIYAGMEGIVRQLKTGKREVDVVLIGAGCRPGTGPADGLIDHSIHRRVAEHYGLAFVDVQDYMHRTLEQRGQTWDDVSITFEDGDDLHLNDYGNQIWFDALRNWFDEETRAYDKSPGTPVDEALPPPLESAAFAATEAVNPARRNKRIQLEGGWEKKDRGVVPWYFDDLLVGRPGDKLTFTFTGTAIGALSLVYPNGLKMEATLDGEDVPGPYTNFMMEFGKFFMIAHGLENTEHVLELTVAEPMSRKNKLPDPTAEIGYLCVATGDGA